jgi:hypothetical protein
MERKEVVVLRVASVCDVARPLQTLKNLAGVDDRLGKLGLRRRES